jgi:uncharacterized protein
MSQSVPGDLPPDQFALDPHRFRDRIFELYREHDPLVESRELERRRIESVQSIYDCIFSGEFSRWDTLCWSDLEMQLLGPASIPITGTWRGLDEILAAMRRNFAWLEQQNVTPQTVVAQGNLVVVVAHEAGIYRLTGASYRLHFVHEFLFEGDRVRRVRQIVDGLQLAEAIWGKRTIPQSG